MLSKKFFLSLVGAGMIISAGGMAWAQEATPEATPVATPEVTPDAGVEAVMEAQDGDVSSEEVSSDASAKLDAIMDKKGWMEGWDDVKQRHIVKAVESFNIANPKSEKFFVLREMAAKRAVLTAKADIIEGINSNMSALDIVEMPGSDLNEKFGAERQRIEDELAEQRMQLARLVEAMDKEQAEALRKTDIGDRLNSLMDAVIKKLDTSYASDNRNKQAQANYVKLKAAYEKAKADMRALAEKAQAMKEEVSMRQASAVAKMAAMPLFGATVMTQAESWNDKTGEYQVGVLLCWSKKLERAARAVVTGEDYRVKPKKGKTIRGWLNKEWKSGNLASMVGPRTFIDQNGDRWFLGITARDYSSNRSSTKRRNKGIAELFAQQMAVFCLYADVESHKKAEQMLEESGNEIAGDKTAVAESLAQNMSQSFKNKKVRGLVRVYQKELMHPITHSKIFFTAWGINSTAAKRALELEKINYATKIMSNRHQTVERGRDAANKAAVKASENRKEDYDKGYQDQSQRVKGELDSREAPAAAARKSRAGQARRTAAPKAQKVDQKATGGVFGGEEEVDDDDF